MGKRLQTTVAATCMKTMLMVFNFIFWVTGIVLLVIGIWIKVSLHQFLELSDEYNDTVPYVFIGTGAAIVLVGFLACGCTVKGQPILLYLFSAFLLVVFFLEVGAAISGYVFRGKLIHGFSSGLNKSINSYGQKRMMDQNIDNMQEMLSCCGVNNYTDWFNTKWASGTEKVPKSCCRNVTSCPTDVVISDVTYPLIYNRGCYHVVMEFMDKRMIAIVGVAAGIACFQLLGMVLSCCLAKHVNKTKYEQVA